MDDNSLTNLYDFGSCIFPVIYNNEKIIVNTKITSITTFECIFSPDRYIVNPTLPKKEVIGQKTFLTFDKLGEYYLKFNNIHKLKIVVLERNAEISENVLRLYDFLAANLVTADNDDENYPKNRYKYIFEFFTKENPMLLTCGCILNLFNDIIRERFSLPTRDISLTGTWLYNEKISKSIHLVNEIYLPDKNKWVMFDIPTGFVAKWLSCFEITNIIRKNSLSNTRFILNPDKKNLFNEHYNVKRFRSKEGEYTCKLDSDGNINIKNIISTNTYKSVYTDLFNVIFSGPTFFGNIEMWNIEGKYDRYISGYHTCPLLSKGQIDLVTENNLTAKIINPIELEKILDKSYCNIINEKKWLDKLPLS